MAVGKSTFSNVVATLLSEDTGLDVAVIASDGFLYPNSVLAEQGLSDRKGFPDSYDVAAITASRSMTTTPTTSSMRSSKSGVSMC